MDKDFRNLVVDFENTLLDLKTSREFYSIRTAKYLTSFPVSSGRYLITYESIQYDIMSFIFFDTQNIDTYMYVYKKTPINNTQEIEVDISSGSKPLQIISNAQVVSVTAL